MRVEQARRLADEFVAHDERSMSARIATLELLNVDDPFSRDAQDEHITTAALVVSDRGVLLHLHKMIKRWIGPGGHVDDGEFLVDAVVRETLEETGLQAWHPDGGPVVLDMDVHPTPVGHIHHDFRFLLLADPLDTSPPPGESPDVRWFDPEEALSSTDSSFAAAIEQARLSGHLNIR